MGTLASDSKSTTMTLDFDSNVIIRSYRSRHLCVVGFHVEIPVDRG